MTVTGADTCQSFDLCQSDIEPGRNLLDAMIGVDQRLECLELKAVQR